MVGGPPCHATHGFTESPETMRVAVTTGTNSVTCDQAEAALCVLLRSTSNLNPRASAQGTPSPTRICALPLAQSIIALRKLPLACTLIMAVHRGRHRQCTWCSGRQWHRLRQCHGHWQGQHWQRVTARCQRHAAGALA